MKYFFLLLFSLSLIHCERDKSSLPGSYKLEKSPEQTVVEESFYGLSFNLNLKKDAAELKIVAYSEKTGLAVKTIKDSGILTLKSTTSEEKRYLQIGIKDKEKDRDLIFNLPLDSTSKELKPLDFVYDEIVFSVVYTCQGAQCESIKFSINIKRPGDASRVAFRGVAYYWILIPVDGAFIFKAACVMADSNNSKKLIDEPYYFMNLPRESSELKCTDY